MKKGKTAKLSGYRTFKSHYGTIDAQNLKSIYLNIQTWVEPKDEVENYSPSEIEKTFNEPMEDEDDLLLNRYNS